MYKNSWSLLLILLMACTSGPEPIQYGKDQCAYCRMTIADPQFAAEIVTTKGRVYKMDAIECMIRYQQENTLEIGQTLVTPFDRPAILTSTDSVMFVISSTINSPMGANLAAFASRRKIDSLKADNASMHTWKEVVAKIGRGDALH